jgi:putative endonuclease
MPDFFVYILASRRQGTLYIGVTNNVARRVTEHRDGTVPGFTKKYGVDSLVHIERFNDIREAIAREKAIKKWRRAWKVQLIEKNNPAWVDLYDAINS